MLGRPRAQSWSDVGPARPLRPPGQSWDAFCVLDVEATCTPGGAKYNDRVTAFGYPNEIIEFPVLVFGWVEDEAREEWRLEEVVRWRSVVRPAWGKTLSKFAKELTGISQAEVDAAPGWAEVLSKFEQEVITPHGLFTQQCRTIWVTDGPWDLRDFVRKTSWIAEVATPFWLEGEFVNLRTTASDYFSRLAEGRKAIHREERREAERRREEKHARVRRAATEELEPDPQQAEVGATLGRKDRATTAPPTLPPPVASTSAAKVPAMVGLQLKDEQPNTLSILDLLRALHLGPFQGRLHSGIDDAFNLSRILVALASSPRNMPIQKNAFAPRSPGNPTQSRRDRGGGGGERKKVYAWMWWTVGPVGKEKWEGGWEGTERRGEGLAPRERREVRWEAMLKKLGREVPVDDDDDDDVKQPQPQGSAGPSA